MSERFSAANSPAHPPGAAVGGSALALARLLAEKA